MCIKSEDVRSYKSQEEVSMPYILKVENVPVDKPTFGLPLAWNVAPIPVSVPGTPQNPVLVSSEEKQQNEVLDEIKIEEHNDLNDHIYSDAVSSFFNRLMHHYHTLM